MTTLERFFAGSVPRCLAVIYSCYIKAAGDIPEAFGDIFASRVDPDIRGYSNAGSLRDLARVKIEHKDDEIKRYSCHP